MQKGDNTAAPDALLHALLAAHKIPICLQIVPTWQDFIQKSEPLSRPQRPPLRGGMQQRRSRRSKIRDMRVGFASPTQPPWAASFGY